MKVLEIIGEAKFNWSKPKRDRPPRAKKRQAPSWYSYVPTTDRERPKDRARRMQGSDGAKKAAEAIAAMRKKDKPTE